jgi:hypothetical protein
MSVNFDNPQFIRVAWFDRKEQKFDKGSWQAIGEKSLNDLNLKKEWIGMQNIRYPCVKYWLEVTNNRFDEKNVRNLDSCKIVNKVGEKIKLIVFSELEVDNYTLRFKDMKVKINNNWLIV